MQLVSLPLSGVDPGFSEGGGGGGGGGANDGKGEPRKVEKLLPLMFVANNK